MLLVQVLPEHALTLCITAWGEAAGSGTGHNMRTSVLTLKVQPPHAAARSPGIY